MRQFLAVLFQQVGQFQQHIATGCRGDLGPMPEAAMSRFHRCIDIGKVRVGHLGDDFAGGRINHVQRLAGVALDVTTIDKQGMASTKKGFNLWQQRNIAHGFS
ncbi:hypothetical protein D3C71_1505000 [compost metagenome]